MRKGIYDNNYGVHTFWDLGIDDYTAIIFVQIVGSEIRIVDSIMEHNK